MDFKELEGKTLVSIDNDDNEEMIFTCDDGRRFKMYHEQDCCENVYVESIVGDLKDLLNTPILGAEEVISSDFSEGESCTWTFYKLRTIKGYIDIRWYGASNGYYSESVDFIELHSFKKTGTEKRMMFKEYKEGLGIWFADNGCGYRFVKDTYFTFYFDGDKNFIPLDAHKTVQEAVLRLTEYAKDNKLG